MAISFSLGNPIKRKNTQISKNIKFNIFRFLSLINTRKQRVKLFYTRLFQTSLTYENNKFGMHLLFIFLLEHCCNKLIEIGIKMTTNI